MFFLRVSPHPSRVQAVTKAGKHRRIESVGSLEVRLRFEHLELGAVLKFERELRRRALDEHGRGRFLSATDRGTEL